MVSFNFGRNSFERRNGQLLANIALLHSLNQKTCPGLVCVLDDLFEINRLIPTSMEFITSSMELAGSFEFAIIYL